MILDKEEMNKVVSEIKNEHTEYYKTCSEYVKQLINFDFTKELLNSVINRLLAFSFEYFKDKITKNIMEYIKFEINLLLYDELAKDDGYTYEQMAYEILSNKFPNMDLNKIKKIDGSEYQEVINVVELLKKVRYKRLQDNEMYKAVKIKRKTEDIKANSNNVKPIANYKKADVEITFILEMHSKELTNTINNFTRSKLKNTDYENITDKELKSLRMKWKNMTIESISCDWDLYKFMKTYLCKNSEFINLDLHLLEKNMMYHFHNEDAALLIFCNEKQEIVEYMRELIIFILKTTPCRYLKKFYFERLSYICSKKIIPTSDDKTFHYISDGMIIKSSNMKKLKCELNNSIFKDIPLKLGLCNITKDDMDDVYNTIVVQVNAIIDISVLINHFFYEYIILPKINDVEFKNNFKNITRKLINIYKIV